METVIDKEITIREYIDIIKDRYKNLDTVVHIKYNTQDSRLFKFNGDIEGTRTSTISFSK